MSRKKYKARIYPRAENDLADIKEYFENIIKTSPNKLFKKFYDATELLETNPFIRPLLEDLYLRQCGYRMFSVDNYLAFYKIVDEEIQIHRFLYGKRNYYSILQKT